MEDQHNLNNAIEGELQQAAQYIRSQHLRDLVHTPDRAALCLQFEDLTVDCTRQPITLKILEKLVMLAKAKSLPDLIDDLFAGKAINLSEGRPVTHCALRSPEYQSREDYKKRSSFVDSLRANESITTVVNLGIGGSDLGPAMVTQGLAGFHDGPALHFVGNVDPAALYDALAQCDPHKTLFIVTSKSFTTAETLANASLAKDWLQKNGVAADRAVVAVTANTERAKNWGIATDHIFAFDDGVGGRYSLWSAVGLPVMIAIGSKNFAALLSGAHAMDTHFKTASLGSNLPVIMGLLRIWHRTFLGNTAYGLMPYDQRLLGFPGWAQQLEMESNGKSVDRFGNALSAPAGPLIWGGVGTNSQHSFFQWLHQGGDIVPIDILVARKSTIRPDDPTWQASHKTLLINAISQAEALAIGASNTDEPHRHFPGNRPSVLISWETTTPYALGRLLALYEHITIVSGFIWGVNSFDQWGVEIGKSIASDIANGRDLSGLSPAGIAFLKKMDE